MDFLFYYKKCVYLGKSCFFVVAVYETLFYNFE